MDLSIIPEDHSFKKFSSERPIIKKPVDTRIPIINESKSKCLWRLKQHCSYEEYQKKNLIKSHDIVYF